MLSWLKTVNKANIAAALAFVSPLFAKWFGISIPLEVQGAIAAVAAWVLTFAIRNKPEAGTAVVEVKTLPPAAQVAVVQRADAVGAGVAKPNGTVTKSSAWAGLLALALAVAVMGPLTGCGFMRAISGEPTDVSVPQTADFQLLRAGLLFEGVLDAIDKASDPGPDQLIAPGSPLAQRIGDAVGAATDALEVATVAVLEKQSTMDVAVQAAIAAINRAVVIFAEAKNGS